MDVVERRMFRGLWEQQAEAVATAAIDLNITYYRHKPSGNCDGHTTELDGGGWLYNGREEPPGWYLYQRCKKCGKGFMHGPAPHAICH